MYLSTSKVHCLGPIPNYIKHITSALTYDFCFTKSCTGTLVCRLPLLILVLILVPLKLNFKEKTYVNYILAQILSFVNSFNANTAMF